MPNRFYGKNKKIKINWKININKSNEKLNYSY